MYLPNYSRTISRFLDQILYEKCDIQYEKGYNSELAVDLCRKRDFQNTQCKYNMLCIGVDWMHPFALKIV